MIICKSECLRNYAGSLPGIGAALEALESLGTDPRPCRVAFEDGYLFIQEGMTAPVEAGMFEAHRKYIDVQVLLKGCERILWNDLKALAPEGGYNEKTDKLVLTGSGAIAMDIPAGMAWAAFPEDAHMACRDPGRQSRFLKAVIKLEIPHGGTKEA